MPTEKPLCRFCLASSNTKQNPLVDPCECRGSIQYVHRQCLDRWRKIDPARNAVMCLLCMQPYRLYMQTTLEVVPSNTILIFLLRYPFVLCLFVNYVALFQYTLQPSSLFLFDTLELYQYIFQILYGGLFLFHWNVQRTDAYWKQLKTKESVILVGLFLTSNYYISKHQFLAVVPLNYVMGISWHRHIQVVERLNED